MRKQEESGQLMMYRSYGEKKWKRNLMKTSRK